MATGDEGFVQGLTSDNATLLLAAAEQLGLSASVVRTSVLDGGFYAPAEVVAKAAEPEQASEPEHPVRRRSKSTSEGDQQQ